MSKVEEKPVLTHEQAKDFMFDQLMTRRQKREAMILYHRVRIACEMRGFLDPMELIHQYDALLKRHFDQMVVDLNVDHGEVVGDDTDPED